jgi:hypothetical protein
MNCDVHEFRFVLEERPVEKLSLRARLDLQELVADNTELTWLQLALASLDTPRQLRSLFGAVEALLTWAKGRLVPRNMELARSAAAEIGSAESWRIWVPGHSMLSPSGTIACVTAFGSVAMESPSTATTSLSLP